MFLKPKKQKQKKTKPKGGGRKLLVTERFMTVIMVSQVYLYLQTHEIVYIKYL